MTPRWWTPTVIAIAEGILADAAFDRLPVLADALEDGGFEGPYLTQLRLGRTAFFFSILGHLAAIWELGGITLGSRVAWKDEIGKYAFKLPDGFDRENEQPGRPAADPRHRWCQVFARESALHITEAGEPTHTLCGFGVRHTGEAVRVEAFELDSRGMGWWTLYRMPGPLGRRCQRCVDLFNRRQPSAHPPVPDSDPKRD